VIDSLLFKTEVLVDPTFVSTAMCKRGDRAHVPPGGDVCCSYHTAHVNHIKNALGITMSDKSTANEQARAVEELQAQMLEMRSQMTVLQVQMAELRAQMKEEREKHAAEIALRSEQPTSSTAPAPDSAPATERTPAPKAYPKTAAEALAALTEEQIREALEDE
jgi:uncharacterized coiled-coil protein SlyX